MEFSYLFTLGDSYAKKHFSQMQLLFSKCFMCEHGSYAFGYLATCLEFEPSGGHTMSKLEPLNRDSVRIPLNDVTLTSICTFLHSLLNGTSFFNCKLKLQMMSQSKNGHDFGADVRACFLTALARAFTQLVLNSQSEKRILFERAYDWLITLSQHPIRRAHSLS